MTEENDSTESKRLLIQSELDSLKLPDDRNKLGQFATPTQLARDVIAYGLTLLPESMPIRFLDPAVGTGSFYSALSSTGRRIESARGYEIDPHYGKPAQEFWKATNLDIELADFTLKVPPSDDWGRATLLICNPPYVRHHHLDSDTKSRLQVAVAASAKLSLSGLAGLYCYFIGLAHSWMADEGIAGWLIPSEFMDVNYGRALKAYLLRDVSLLRIHRFDPNDVQFDDALVSSAVVWLKKQPPRVDHEVEFTYGGTLMRPSLSKRVSSDDLLRTDKWTRFPKQDAEVAHTGYRLGDLFSIKRGLATGDNKFFILDESAADKLNLPGRFLRPILPSTRYIKSDEIASDEAGIPLLEKRLFLIDCDRPQEEIERDEPALWAYLQAGLERVSSGYLCRSRRYWYSQERRPAAPIICTYIGRSDHAKAPFRFLLNNSNATATNVYLMLYPTPILARQLSRDTGMLRRIWQGLNAISRETLLGNGRVYGGGMHKLEPRELSNVPVDELAAIAGLHAKRTPTQLNLSDEAAA
jgi:adenine-specific DNA-methyltransferase